MILTIDIGEEVQNVTGEEETPIKLCMPKIQKLSYSLQGFDEPWAPVAILKIKKNHLSCEVVTTCGNANSAKT